MPGVLVVVWGGSGQVSAAQLDRTPPRGLFRCPLNTPSDGHYLAGLKRTSLGRRSWVMRSSILDTNLRLWRIVHLREAERPAPATRARSKPTAHLAVELLWLGTLRFSAGNGGTGLLHRTWRSQTG